MEPEPTKPNTFDRPKTILWLDDDLALLHVIKAILGEELGPKGYCVWTVSNSHEALRILRSVEVDLLIQDIGRPDIGGEEFCQLMAADPQLRWIPILICAGYPERHLRELRAKYKAVVGTLPKPFEFPELWRSIESALATANDAGLGRRHHG
jgi:CheY-like chemotaxis protein